MKHTYTKGFTIAPFCGAVVYTAAGLFFPDKNPKGTSTEEIFIGLFLLSIINYIFSFIIGYPLVKLFNKFNMLYLQNFVIAFTVICVTSFYLFVVIASNPTSTLIYTDHLLLLFFGCLLGFVTSLIFCKLSGITSRSKMTPKNGAF